MSKKIAAVGLALVLALSLTACGKKGATPEPSPAPVGEKEPKAPGAYQVNLVQDAAAPQALKDWAAAEQGKTQPAYKVHVENGVTYVAVTAGQQSSGGWTANLQRTAVTQNNAKDLLQLDVVWMPPSGFATMALTNPVAYFRAEPAVVGEVKVQTTVTPVSQTQQPKPRTFSVEQSDGMGALIFHATGDLKAPKVEFRLAGKVLNSTDLKQQANGEWTWSMPRPAERSEQIEIQLYSGAELVGVAPMRYETGVGQRWSNNFYVDQPRQLDPKTLLLKGKARAFEAAFVVEVRHNGEVITRQPVKAKEGAPAYGDFEQTLKLDREIPAGSEVWFLIVSMKDSSDMVEVIAPIVSNSK